VSLTEKQIEGTTTILNIKRHKTFHEVHNAALNYKETNVMTCFTLRICQQQ